MKGQLGQLRKPAQGVAAPCRPAATGPEGSSLCVAFRVARGVARIAEDVATLMSVLSRRSTPWAFGGLCSDPCAAVWPLKT